MAHFSKLDENNIVTEIMVISNDDMLDGDGNESEAVGVAFIQNLLNDGATWKQTSYNTYGGKYNSDVENSVWVTEGAFRKNYGGIGYTYDETLDAFLPPKDFDSWTLNTTTCLYEPPIAYPEDGKVYYWDEDVYNNDEGDPKTLGWVLHDNQ